jgi:hypothetical protein
MDAFPFERTKRSRFDHTGSWDRGEGMLPKAESHWCQRHGSSRMPRVGQLNCIHREVTDCVDAVLRGWGRASVQCRPSKHARHSRFDKLCPLLLIPMRYTPAIRPEESRRNDLSLPCVPKNRVSLRCPKTRQKPELSRTRRSSSKGTQSPQRRCAAERDQKSTGSTQDHTGLRIASLPHELPPEIFDSY